MKIVRLTEADTDNGEERFKGKKFPESALEHIVTDESTTILKPDGSVLCMLLKRVLSKRSVQAAYPVLRKIELTPTNRATATIGAEKTSQYMLRADGTRSKTVGVRQTEFPEIRGMSSAIIGYYDRHVRWPYCRATAFNLDEPEKFEQLLPFVREVNDVFRTHAPERWMAQAEIAARTNPAWVIPETCFTTITVNRNYPAACHMDAGDFRDGFGVMTAMRSGTYDGGITYWPAFKVGARMDTGDVCLADVHEWHGVSDLRGVPGRFERVSCVFYYREKMCRCGSPAEELDRAKNRKLGDSLYDREASDEAG